MDKRVNLFQILREENQLEKLLVYPAQTRISDPTEGTTTKTFLNPLPIYGYVTQESFAALRWKYTGLMPQGTIKVLIEHKNKSLMLNAYKIKYKDNYYSTLKDDSQNFQYLERKDYTIFILGLIG
jgi:hypothetical protein